MNAIKTANKHKMKLWKSNFENTNEERMALKQNKPSNANSASILNNGYTAREIKAAKMPYKAAIRELSKTPNQNNKPTIRLFWKMI